MQLKIPVLVTQEKSTDQTQRMTTVRRLFEHEPVFSVRGLQNALNKLSQELRPIFDAAANEASHYNLAWYAFMPEFSTEMITLRFELSNQSFECRFLIVMLEAFDKRIAFAPTVGRFWFEIDRGEDPAARALEFFTEHFRELERRNGKGSVNPMAYASGDDTFVTTISLNVPAPQIYKAPVNDLRALLAGGEKMNGEVELRRVGRNLDALYPEDLERAVGRDAECARLAEILADNRPIVIIGRSQTGKTNLVHELVYRQNLKQRAAAKRMTWLLSPQRLISGMSFVGQWENRVTAILDEARAKEHLLYFDDLVGLFQAGVSAGSDLCVAQVLKPYLDRGDVRVIAEITPEAWRVLNERDRAFASLFRIFRLDETDADATVSILLAVRRELEGRRGVRFSADAIPEVIDLERRFDREAAFPGKAAALLTRLAARFPTDEITRDFVLREFESRSGLSPAFLDDRVKLERREVAAAIAEGVIGQNAAVEAATDAIMTAKARLNDTERPISSFLFLGPTGVGKTEAAKQIAAHLFGGEDRLLRFDMNEFVGPYDAARLVGTFAQPDGLLTSAIRRQPFSVILLDEIEKAHPDVFNLLLQLLGEGRLTDAHGRTADFSNAIVILTSNLGAREARGKLGFRETNESSDRIYRTAAEKFFRPEFFNRIDRIIPFGSLSRDEVGRIARLRLQSMLKRSGFERRNCRVEIEPSAMERIIDEGYVPELGARALKRALEKNLARPVAMRLAAIQTSAPVIVRVSRIGDEFATAIEEIKPVAVSRANAHASVHANLEERIATIERFLDRVEDGVEHLRPKGEIIPGDPHQKRYFLVMEYVRRIERMLERAERLRRPRKQGRAARADERRLVRPAMTDDEWQNILGVPNLALRIRRLAADGAAYGTEGAEYFGDIDRESALLEAVFRNLETAENERCAMFFRCADAHFGKHAIPRMREIYSGVFAGELGLSVIENDPAESTGPLIIEGSFASLLAEAECGNHVFVSPGGDFTPIDVSVRKLDRKESADFDTSASTEGFEIIRIYNERRQALDFRSGLVTRDAITSREMRSFILSGLEIPAEVKD